MFGYYELAKAFISKAWIAIVGVLGMALFFFIKAKDSKIENLETENDVLKNNVEVAEIMGENNSDTRSYEEGVSHHNEMIDNEFKGTSDAINGEKEKSSNGDNIGIHIKF